MSSIKPSAVRRLILLFALPAVAGLVMSCAPPSGGDGGTTEPPAARAVLSPASGPAGSFVNVAAPDGSCLTNASTYQSLQAAMTIPGSGIVIAQGYQNLFGGFSNSVVPDAYVRLLVPPATAAGKYFIYLSCYGYLDQYSYAPATFTVTPG